MRRAPEPHDPELIRRALLPLAPTPQQAAWNHVEFEDLLAEAPPRVPAAVLVGLVARPEGLCVLLTRRTDTLSRHAGQVSFPGGRIDPDDRDAVDAALREAWEEVALAREQVQPLGFLDPYDTLTGFRVLPVVAWLAPDYRVAPNPGEVAEAFEVPLAALARGERLERHALDYRGRLRHYWEYREGPHRIWGATAAMLVNLGRRLGAHIPGD